MATKPYHQKEETPSVESESIVAYQPTPYAMEILRQSEEDYKAGRVYTEEEVDMIVEKWVHS